MVSPIESISSMKIIDGACCLRLIIRVRTKRWCALYTPSHDEQLSHHARTFTNVLCTSDHQQSIDHAADERTFCTSSDPETRMKQQSVWWATARASRVLPVPGGPYIKTP